MKKLIALLMCILVSILPFAEAEEPATTRISGHASSYMQVLGDEIYLEVQKEAFFGDHCSIYRIVPGEKPVCFARLFGYYGRLAVHKNQLMIQKFDMSFISKLFSGFIYGSEWYTILPNGRTKKVTFPKIGTYTYVCDLTRDGIYDEDKENNIKTYYYWDEAAQDWRDTGLTGTFTWAINDGVISHFSRNDKTELQLFDPETGSALQFPDAYDAEILGAIWHDGVLIYMDNYAVKLLDRTVQTPKVVFQSDTSWRKRGYYYGQIFLEGENLYFTDPETTVVMQYNLATDTLSETKVSIPDCQEMAVLNGCVYWVDDGILSGLATVSIGNLSTGETTTVQCAAW